MSTQVRKIESATVVFCVFQAVFLLVSGLSYWALAYRVRHFDYGKLSIDEGKIIDAVQLATKEFLHDYQTNLDAKVSIDLPRLDLDEMPGIVYGTFKSIRARIGESDYMVGDLIRYGTNIYEIAMLDFEGQRMYCVDDKRNRLVVRMVGLVEGDGRIATDGRTSDRVADGDTDGRTDSRSGRNSL